MIESQSLNKSYLNKGTLIIVPLGREGREELRQQLKLLSKHQLEKLTKQIGLEYRERYVKKNKSLKYGNLPRVLSREQLITFFNTFPTESEDDKNFKKLLLRQFFYARRAGELADMEIVRSQRLVKIVNHKAKKVQYTPLIDGTECLWDVTKHYHCNPINRRFVKHADSLGEGFNFSYGISTSGRVLHQFTSHSLRKSAANLLRIKTSDPYKAAVFLGHSESHSFGSTAYYLNYSLDDMRKDLNETFGELVKELIGGQQ